MNVFDEIRDSLDEMPDIVKATPADVLEGLEFGVALAKLIGTKTDLEMQRVFFIRIASMAIQGIQVLDAEIDAEAEAAQEADDEIPF